MTYHSKPYRGRNEYTWRKGDSNIPKPSRRARLQANKKIHSKLYDGMKLSEKMRIGHEKYWAKRRIMEQAELDRKFEEKYDSLFDDTWTSTEQEEQQEDSLQP